MKKVMFILAVVTVLVACGGNASTEATTTDTTAAAVDTTVATVDTTAVADSAK